MAVLVEAISVIVRAAAIHQKYPGGWEAFKRIIPNQTLCADNELVRIGFMTPDDVEETQRGTLLASQLAIFFSRHIFTPPPLSSSKWSQRERGWARVTLWNKS